MSRRNKLATKTAIGSDSFKGGTTTVVALWKQKIYGLVSEPSWLRAGLTVYLLAAGYVKNRTTNACSHCCLPMRHRKANCFSMLTTFMEGGKETHRTTMEGFYDKYRCG